MVYRVEVRRTECPPVLIMGAAQPRQTGTIWTLDSLLVCLLIRSSSRSEFIREDLHTIIVERQNEKRGLESGFGSAGYVNAI